VGRPTITAGLVVLALTIAGCRQGAGPDSGRTTPPRSTAAIAVPSTPGPSVEVAPTTPLRASSPTPSPTVSPTPTPTPVPGVDLPVGSGSVVVDGMPGAATGDCVVSGAALVDGELDADAVVDLAVRVTLPQSTGPVALRVSRPGPVALRLDGRDEDGAVAWEAAEVSASLDQVGDAGFAVLVVEAVADPAGRPPWLPVAPLTPSPGPTSTPGGSPAPPEPQRTRPEPEPGGVVASDAPLPIEASVVCRVTDVDVD
jgi:uncharacterized Zn-binding protein involved in type VI secretion